MYASFHTVGLPRRSLKDVIKAVKDAGYAGIELNAETLPWAEAHITPATPKEEREDIRRAIASAKLKVPAIGAHIPMLHPEEALRRQAIDFMKGCNDLAVEMGSSYVHVLSGPLAANTSREIAWGWFADAIGELVEHASERDVQLGIEAIAGHIFHSAKDYARLASDLPGVPFKINFDPSQIVVQGASPFEIVDRFADRIAHVHMKDGSGRFPDFAFPPLGEGEIDFKALVDRLRDAGYDGALSIEYEAQVYGFTRTDEQILDESRAFLSNLSV
ncbi:sugar phosphate isomerase/epimerase family protein [Paraburkholderia sp. B3]|uniref:sugar phosphate isomerase/epimerase family protein n=1 Tax=Paraburkholderia sp. B3 TaxID=3134791 RepID=UPI003981CDF7